MSYARYKFNKAVRSLGEAGVKRREWLASDHVHRLLLLTQADIPVELAHEFDLFQLEMTPIVRASEKFDDELGSVIQAIDEATVGRIVDRVKHMHEIIESEVEHQSTR